MVAEKLIISETIVKVDSQMMIQNNDVCSQQFRPQTSMSNDVCSQQFRPQTSMSNDVCSQQYQDSNLNILRFKLETLSRRFFESTLSQDKTTVLQPHSSEVGFINHMLILKLSKAQVDQGSQIKMIQVKEMMQDNDLKNLKSKDKGSKSRSQSMDEQSHYKQDKTITRQSINVKRHIFNVIGDTEKFEERDLNIGGDC
ncbi:hypothetical protein Tco_0347522 [Tanacetum coccineum]